MAVKLKYDKSDITFLDDDELKKYQSELLKMISDVFTFFDENRIAYSLSGGSILGAIRHKGFIPW
ncbi:LicD family protein, partial [Streptococcus pneumoniae]